MEDGCTTDGDEEGSAVVEYVLVLFLVALLAAGAVQAIGGSITSGFREAAAALEGVPPAAAESPPVPRASLVCFHRGLGEHSPLWSQPRCRPAFGPV